MLGQETVSPPTGIVHLSPVDAVIGHAAARNIPQTAFHGRNELNAAVRIFEEHLSFELLCAVKSVAQLDTESILTAAE